MEEVNIGSMIINIDTIIGNTSDDESSNTLFGGHYILQKHIHGIQKTYPYLADAVTLTGGTNAWTLGNKIEVIPADTITSPFDIHCVNTGSASVTDTYQIVLYSGSVGNEVIVGTTRVVKDSAMSSILTKAIISPIFPANTRISMALASKSGGNDTLTVSVEYHEY